MIVSAAPEKADMQEPHNESNSIAERYLSINDWICQLVVHISGFGRRTCGTFPENRDGTHLPVIGLTSKQFWLHKPPRNQKKCLIDG